MLVKLMKIFACSVAVLALAQIASGDSLSSRHFEQEKNSNQSKTCVASDMAAKASVTQIAIERSGPGRQYQAAIKSDGSIEFTGIKAVDRMGEFTGAVSTAEFRELADYAVQSGYFDLKASYRAGMADRSTVYTSVKIGAVEKIVMNYGDKGPSGLKSFERKIEELLDRAALAKKESAKVNP